MCNECKRWVRSIPKEYVLATFTAFMAAIGFFLQKGSSANGLEYWVPFILIGLFLIFCFIGYQTYLNYERNTYDPTMALKYDDIFYEMTKARLKAATSLKSNRDNLSNIHQYKVLLEDIDDVLDFFDTIGFLLKSDQISDKVAHQYFCHWIRGYWVFAEPYIHEWQKKEITRWEHLEELFETVIRIEIKKSKSTREKQLKIPRDDEFLEEEILANQ